MYGAPEAPIADAGRHEDRAARRGAARDRFIADRTDELLRILDSRSRYHVEVDGGPWSPAGTGRIYLLTDVAHWIAEKRDPESAIVLLLMDMRQDLFDAYAADRAEAEADAAPDDRWEDA
jgi:hypothetical protein